MGEIPTLSAKSNVPISWTFRAVIERRFLSANRLASERNLSSFWFSGPRGRSGDIL